MINRPDRQFLVWGYSVSMGRLLLRSNKSETFATRIDVYFQSVQAINLPTHIHGLIVTLAEREAAVRISDESGLLPDDDMKFFDIECGSRRGFVVAGLAIETEDEGDYDQPGKYWPGPPGLGYPTL